ncbi:hypothetical protein [Neisseria wadsworthii]|uniref:Uncharacterized protein n=1 Tax=Neisseria wadsworthii 9715 TaxID=1030841 RepID=G4CPH1_9NEIS|nr:hypothetical protein [Neisseria wadsworthii]EGZ47890.1 hypothetical protein HMPREF9370_0971 [Neisseria wadsworthii 9715]QMT34779.1 hypothetical protein H3L96_06725 [Neisseria wadsworthii]
MFNIQISKPVPVSVIGTYDSLEAASKQVDLFMRGNDPDACANIVPSEKGSGYTVQAVKWQ